jgi:hypothetical protein
MGEQVLTRAERWPDAEAFSDQELIPIQTAVANIIRHLYVRQSETREARTSEPSPIRRADGSARKVRGKRARRGGWPSTKYISRALRRETLAKAGLLARAGYPFTVFVTARAPLGLTDGQAKRHVARSFARLGQALERKGHDYIGLTTYEKVRGFLHGHALVHVRQDCMWVVKRWADRFDERPVYGPIESVNLHARRAESSDLGYVLKQRRFNGPYERPGNFYQKGEPIVGTRVSFTKMARVIIRSTESQQRTASKSSDGAALSHVSHPIAQRIVELARAA